MKYTTILGTTLMALLLTSGNVMAEEDADKTRTRTEVAERVNIADEGEQTREQVRNRYEDGEGDGEQHQHKYQHKYQGSNGSRSGGGARH